MRTRSIYIWNAIQTPYLVRGVRKEINSNDSTLAHIQHKIRPEYSGKSGGKNDD